MRCVNSKQGHNACKGSWRHSKCWRSGPATGSLRAARLALVTALPGIAATLTAAATCTSLAGLTLPETSITAAERVAAGTYTAPDGEVFTNLPAFCRIAATLTPTSDSNIKIEVWMPFSGWNGRFLGTGNGGIGGLILIAVGRAHKAAGFCRIADPAVARQLRIGADGARQSSHAINHP